MDWRSARETSIRNVEDVPKSKSPKLDVRISRDNVSHFVQNFVKGVDKYLQFTNISPNSKSSSNIAR